jgi:hypothetical protein
MTDTITYNKDGSASSFTGDAVLIYRAAHLAGSINMYVQTNGRIIPTRGVGITRMLELAGQVTGKKYKRKEAPQAVLDLNAWVQLAKLSVQEIVQK